jgi:hypothetical protein
VRGLHALYAIRGSADRGMARSIEIDNRPGGETEASAVEIRSSFPATTGFTVVGALDKLAEASKRLGKRYEILVFDDCSRDRTIEVVKDYQARIRRCRSLYTNRVNRGVSRNFVEGAFRATGRYYRQVCGDDCEPPSRTSKSMKRQGGRHRGALLHPHRGRKLYRHVSRASYDPGECLQRLPAALLQRLPDLSHRRRAALPCRGDGLRLSGRAAHALLHEAQLSSLPLTWTDREARSACAASSRSGTRSSRSRCAGCASTCSRPRTASSSARCPCCDAPLSHASRAASAPTAESMPAEAHGRFVRLRREAPVLQLRRLPALRSRRCPTYYSPEQLDRLYSRQAENMSDAPLQARLRTQDAMRGCSG